MSRKILTKEQVVALLRKKQAGRTMVQFANEIGISQPYLSDIYHGKRDPGASVLEYLKLDKIPAYVEVAS